MCLDTCDLCDEEHNNNNKTIIYIFLGLTFLGCKSRPVVKKIHINLF